MRSRLLQERCRWAIGIQSTISCARCPTLASRLIPRSDNSLKRGALSLMSKRRKAKHQLTQLAKKNRPPVPQTPAPALNLGYSQASKVVTKEYRRVQLIIAGCGGIGAYVAQHVGRLMKVLYSDQR